MCHTTEVTKPAGAGLRVTAEQEAGTQPLVQAPPLWGAFSMVSHLLWIPSRRGTKQYLLQDTEPWPCKGYGPSLTKGRAVFKGPVWGEHHNSWLLPELWEKLWESGHPASESSCADMTSTNLPEPRFPHC